jgi:serine/threonine protein kinase/DNA-binding winged helix-turn-helix (wHTH) protein
MLRLWHHLARPAVWDDASAVTEDRQPVLEPSVAERCRRRWHFAACVFDERTLELLVDGVCIELERKPLELLQYLLQHAGEVCTKDELLAAVWAGRVLSETVLTKCVGRLREVLGDRDQDIIKTAYGFGYRLVAVVRIETLPVVEPPRFDFSPGTRPPDRPLWTLVERLGVGGHGEAWRGRHEKTHEQRVFKFALDESSLGALKREITLFRIINDALGDRARVVRLLDWNLEQAPYFIEAEYVSGGSLLDWVARRGGIAAIPLVERLELIANVASALSAVHSVGVLHKDLKPSNILVKPSGDGSVQLLLADFGSGGILDPAYIKKLGITRLGFTKTVAAVDGQWATPLYLAPEVLGGQPFTVKSDIYALGVIFYQFLAGDFQKLLSPGWEREIDDELLRSDIASAVDGNPNTRLADAASLARCLQSLEARRQQVAIEREAAVRAERAQRLLERARSRRFGLVIAFGVLLLGLAMSTALYFKALRAQERMAIAAARSNAVVEFLGNDVFAPVSSGAEPVKDTDVLTLLHRAGTEVDSRFAAQPDIASQVHFVIGRSFDALYESQAAVKHFNRAMELGQSLQGEGSESALRSASELIQIEYALGTLRTSMPRYEAALAAGSARFVTKTPVLLELRLANAKYLLGDWAAAVTAFETLTADLHAMANVSPELTGRSDFHYGQLLMELGRHEQAQARLTSAIDAIGSALGEGHVLVAEATTALGRSLGEAGRYDQAFARLAKAHELAMRWAPPDTWTVVRPRYFKALVLLHQDHAADAEVILASIVQMQDSNRAAYLATHQDGQPELDHTASVRHALGRAYARQGKHDEAMNTLRRAVEIGELADGALHPAIMSTRLSLAEVLLASGRPVTEVHAILASTPRSALADLEPGHPIVAQWLRVEGLLALALGRTLAASESLRESLRIFESAYGTKHWRVALARDDLARAGTQRGEL